MAFGGEASEGIHEVVSCSPLPAAGSNEGCWHSSDTELPPSFSGEHGGEVWRRKPWSQDADTERRNSSVQQMFSGQDIRVEDRSFAERALRREAGGRDDFAAM